MSDMNEWLPQSGEATTLDQMDKLIEDLREARASYDEAKRKATELHGILEEKEKLVLNTLKANGRTKYEAEGVALVYYTTKEIYSTPKTNEEKRALFSYIQNKYGVDACTSMLSINHNTLNSWANKEVESDPLIIIPGLDKPTSVETLFFKKK